MNNPYPPAQSPYPQQPQYTAPPKKKRKWPWILAAAIVLIVIIAVSAGHSNNTNAPTAAVQSGNTIQSGNAPQSPATQMGAQVRDGKFAFTVNSVKSGIASVGDSESGSEQAQGQFVLVNLTVANISNRAQDFLGGNQKLVDAQNRQFDDDTMAETEVAGNADAMLDNINPGNQVTTTLVFDIPGGARPTSIELHDSMFSGGAKVNLR